MFIELRNNLGNLHAWKVKEASLEKQLTAFLSIWYSQERKTRKTGKKSAILK